MNLNPQPVDRVCCPDLDELTAFGLGKTTSEPWEVLAQHVSECPGCGSTLRGLQDSGDKVLANLRQLARGAWRGRAGERSPAASAEASEGSRTTIPERPFVEAAVPPLLIPSFPFRLGVYELLGQVGEGGMGVVYRARQGPLNRTVALKMIGPKACSGPHAVARFRVEGEAIARLEHPNVVRVYELNVHEGRPYLAMEFVEGGTLKDRLAEGPLPQPEAARIFHALALAAHAAHREQIVHRDLKPSNVLLAADGTPKLSDFGLAKLLDAADGHTQTDAILGTPEYMAPEQASGKARLVGPLTDVYALGAILYEALTGRPPFRAETRLQTLEEVRRGEPVKPSHRRPEVSRDLEAVCLKCLAKEPARRYASAEELAQDLERWLVGQPTLARPERWWGAARRHPFRTAAAMLLLCAAVGAPAVWRQFDPDRPLDEHLSRLAGGQAVTLIGPTGPPAWWLWRTGGEAATLDTNPDGTFRIHTWGRSLLQLLPDPVLDRYRLRAQVQHHNSDRNGRIGLFLAHHEHPTGKGGVHVFLNLAYNDVHPFDEGLPPELRPTPPRKNPVFFHPHLWSDSQRGAGWDLGAGGRTPLLFEPAGPRGGRWRDLAVEVTPAGAQGYWGKGPREPVGRPLSTMEMTEGLADALKRKRSHGTVANDPAVAAMVLGFTPRGALGLYVETGSAAFRNVVLEPLE